MTICALINDKGELDSHIMAETTDWVEEGWNLVEVPSGYFWSNGSIIKLQDHIAKLNSKLVTPEVI